MNNSLYREEILEHWKNPFNYGKITDADFEIDDYNPLCGDKIHLTGKISGGKIKDVKFISEGCVISKASASILTEFIKGKKVKEIQDLKQQDFLSQIGVTLTVARLKCALLSYSALQKAIKQTKIL